MKNYSFTEQNIRNAMKNCRGFYSNIEFIKVDDIYYSVVSRKSDLYKGNTFVLKQTEKYGYTGFENRNPEIKGEDFIQSLIDIKDNILSIVEGNKILWYGYNKCNSRVMGFIEIKTNLIVED